MAEALSPLHSPRPTIPSPESVPRITTPPNHPPNHTPRSQSEKSEKSELTLVSERRDDVSMFSAASSWRNPFPKPFWEENDIPALFRKDPPTLKVTGTMEFERVVGSQTADPMGVVAGMVSVLLLPVTLPITKVMQASNPAKTLPQTVHDVRNWLFYHHLGRHVDAFERDGIDGDKLVCLGRADVAEKYGMDSKELDVLFDAIDEFIRGKAMAVQNLLVIPMMKCTLQHLRRQATSTKGKLPSSKLHLIADTAGDAAYLDFSRDWATGTGRHMGWQPADIQLLRDAGLSAERLADNLPNIKTAAYRVVLEEFEHDVAGGRRNSVSSHLSGSTQNDPTRLHLPSSPARSDITLTVSAPPNKSISDTSLRDGTLAEADLPSDDSEDEAVDDADLGFAPTVKARRRRSVRKSAESGGGPRQAPSSKLSIDGGIRPLSLISSASPAPPPLNHAPKSAPAVIHPTPPPPTYVGPAYFKLGPLVLRMGLDYSNPQARRSGGGIVLSGEIHRLSAPHTPPRASHSSASSKPASFSPPRPLSFSPNGVAPKISEAHRRASVAPVPVARHAPIPAVSHVRKTPGASGGEDKLKPSGGPQKEKFAALRSLFGRKIGGKV
ncbi:hypothetical protein M427DRAFT_50899 [Gonapodya prolifera JEL478]|uniref:SAM domain-containing protein n=1 Tax=Gonapodya prolifera (strain JEL478) TaxID=1344416 RepID=A0A139AXL6_GONPJ|nr:hypothetical protein M427DRAFT_50899 [Gonapodya prolifera JEL478]|eukprot:KXS21459.1 hypothetical protein M427DRAFT_50899 [Gonapodya prolifera JEL478]